MSPEDCFKEGTVPKEYCGNKLPPDPETCSQLKKEVYNTIIDECEDISTGVKKNYDMDDPPRIITDEDLKNYRNEREAQSNAAFYCEFFSKGRSESLGTFDCAYSVEKVKEDELEMRATVRDECAECNADRNLYKTVEQFQDECENRERGCQAAVQCYKNGKKEGPEILIPAVPASCVFTPGEL